MQMKKNKKNLVSEILKNRFKKANEHFTKPTIRWAGFMSRSLS